MKQLIEIANQLHVLEKKIAKAPDTAQCIRHIQRIKKSLEEMEFTYYSPQGEKYTDSRTDVEANLMGECSDNMRITEVIKPIVMQNNKIVQVGVVIVEAIV
ncbi:hypothetical protein SAMN04515674_11929 [Pseudarcicella hirudinis]|uniref:GrpE protein n=1 Tax=Pseudarcicella hirudinis TaxID=1079859 RepID=A0A1I5YJY6_9BACT|nr:hypothetical protein [Pseudarcicella hirudinis]SFQ44187.1 hypothetical protein SAMN04515674_11929 [Pseudarcicella hirudinis]